jgi:hypothetical protein
MTEFYDKNGLPIVVGDTLTWESANQIIIARVVRKEMRGNVDVLIVAYLGVEVPFTRNDTRRIKVKF